MKYYLVEPTDKAPRLASSGLYDTDYEEHTDDLFLDEEEKAIKGEYPEPFSVVLTEARSIYKKDKLTDLIDLWCPGRAMCVSESVQNVFESLELPFEYFDLHIKGKKIDLQGYRVAKIIGKRIYCVDKESSKIEYSRRGNIDEVTLLVLDESQIPEGVDVFQLGEYITHFYFVSSRVKEAVEQAGLTGFNFIRPEDYKE